MRLADGERVAVQASAYQHLQPKPRRASSPRPPPAHGRERLRGSGMLRRACRLRSLRLRRLTQHTAISHARGGRRPRPPLACAACRLRSLSPGQPVAWAGLHSTRQSATRGGGDGRGRPKLKRLRGRLGRTWRGGRPASRCAAQPPCPDVRGPVSPGR